MWGSLKRPSLRRWDEIFPLTFKAIRKRFSIPEPSEHIVSMVNDSRSDDSDFCQEVLSKHWLTEEQMHHAAERYRLGKSRSGKCIFWMIDEIGQVLDGRIGSSWVSEMLKIRYPENAQYITSTHCLFGLHLLNSQAGPLMVPAYQNVRATGGAVASPFEGGLGGSAPLLVRFLGASEKRTNWGLRLL